MASEKTLLERMANPDAASLHKLEVNESVVIASVLNHINKMLNVRQGSVETVPDFGLPDFNDIVSQFPRAISGVKQSIKYCIDKFEPRLRNVRIEYVEDENDPLKLKFDIQAELMLDENKSSVWFETVLDAAGRATVKR